MAENNMDVQAAELKARAEKLRAKYPEVAFKSFLEEIPPDTYVYLTDLKVTRGDRYIETSDIHYFCESDGCNGVRIFRCAETVFIDMSWRFEFLKYVCRNCGTQSVRFAIAICQRTAPADSPTLWATCIKLGQVPSFGPQTPARLISLIGPDRDLFLQGRRAENRGLGIGAFAYYRRVVENQKNRIISEIARVAKTVGCSEETSKLFAAAKGETQFSKSMMMVKDVIPQTLLIRGQNPLTLLHSALSKGLHSPEMTDERCLQLAKSIRTVLGELADRASEALKNDQEIQSALNALMAIPSESNEATGGGDGQSGAALAGEETHEAT
jgi:hypothetical protein